MRYKNEIQKIGLITGATVSHAWSKLLDFNENQIQIQKEKIAEIIQSLQDQNTQLNGMASNMKKNYEIIVEFYQNNDKINSLSKNDSLSNEAESLFDNLTVVREEITSIVSKQQWGVSTIDTVKILLGNLNNSLRELGKILNESGSEPNNYIYDWNLDK